MVNEKKIDEGPKQDALSETIFVPEEALKGLFKVLGLGEGPIVNGETRKAALDFVAAIAVSGSNVEAPVENRVKIIDVGDPGYIPDRAPPVPPDFVYFHYNEAING